MLPLAQGSVFLLLKRKMLVFLNTSRTPHLKETYYLAGV